MLKVPALEFGAPVTFVIGFKSLDASLHRTPWLPVFTRLIRRTKPRRKIFQFVTKALAQSVEGSVIEE
jgi:hypothetical protein